MVILVSLIRKMLKWFTGRMAMHQVTAYTTRLCGQPDLCESEREGCMQCSQNIEINEYIEIITRVSLGIGSIMYWE